MITIDAKNVYYRLLNRQIREYLSGDERCIVLKNILGQRYIGGGLSSDVKILIYGTPGQDVGAFMNGPTIEIFGNAQDGTGNTMNSGKIIVHGKSGEIPGHSMRGGKIFIEGDVEYRAAIHMKEYIDQIPWLIIGGTAKDYCGEYMAGGRVVILNLMNKNNPVGNSVGTGIHGGAIYIRGKIEKYQLGVGAVFSDLDNSDKLFLKETIAEYSNSFKINLDQISPNDFLKITKKGHRPFGDLYTPAMNIKNQNPKHINLTPPCAYSCPSNIPTPIYLNLIKYGKIKDAQLLMDEYTPFRMSVCGTVCPALCMAACSRNMIDGPVDIQRLAREYYPDFNPEQSKEKRGEHISIIGAGPAGLSAAWQLSKRGYDVSVYDMTGDLGGKIRRAIPRERLSDETLERDLKRIKSLPIKFNLKKQVDDVLFKKIYDISDAVIVATGASISKRINWPGSERIISGLQFLVKTNEGNPIKLSGKDIVIIGSGNVGMDIACESWRLGAKSVTAIDVQKPLASGKEFDMARGLGTEILWPRYIDHLDENKIYFQDGSEIKADVVFISIGETPDSAYLPESVMRDDKGYIVTAEKSQKSSDPKIFGCGDILKPGLITDAIGSGRLAAMEAHAMLNGNAFVYPVKNLVPRRRINTTYFGGESREIDRCISCGVCVFCDKCIDACPQKALSRNGEIFAVDPVRCTGCYTCVNVCPRGALQTEDFAEFLNAVPVEE